jgi:hypothetical protein
MSSSSRTSFSAEYPALHKALEILKAKRRLDSNVNYQEVKRRTDENEMDKNFKCRNITSHLMSSQATNNTVNSTNHITFASVRHIATTKCKSLYPDEKIRDKF